MSTLWRDQAVRDCYEFRRHLLQVQDSAAYFFDAAERIFAPNYVPTKYARLLFNPEIKLGKKK